MSHQFPSTQNKEENSSNVTEINNKKTNITSMEPNYVTLKDGTKIHPSMINVSMENNEPDCLLIGHKGEFRPNLNNKTIPNAHVYVKTLPALYPIQINTPAVVGNAMETKKRVYKRKQSVNINIEKKSELKNKNDNTTEDNLNVLLTLDVSLPVLADEKLRKQLKKVLRKKVNDLIKKGSLNEASSLLKKLDEIEKFEKESKVKTVEKTTITNTPNINNVDNNSSKSTTKRLEYWYGFCSSKKTGVVNNSVDKNKSRFIPFRLQSDSYLGKLDVCYENFDVESFDNTFKSKYAPNSACIFRNPLMILRNDAKKYKTRTFESVLNQPLYSSYFQEKSVNDDNSINYDIDSDEEWYEEDPGDDLSKSDGDEELDQTIVEEDDLEGFLVPHGYLSDDERVSRKTTALNENSKNELENSDVNRDSNSEPRRVLVSSFGPVIFGITYIEDGTDAAENFAYFLEAENIGGCVMKYSPDVIKTLRNFRTLNSNRLNSSKSKRKSNSQSDSTKPIRRRLVDPLEIDKHICEYFVKWDRVKNLLTFSNQFYLHWTESFPNEPRISKKLILERLKVLTVKSNNIYALKDSQLIQP